VLTLDKLSRRNARLYPHKTAFSFDSESVTFVEHNRRINRLVAALSERGVTRGDRFAVMANNCIAYPELYGAAEKGGYLIAPLNFRLTAAEIGGLLRHVRPAVVFAQSRYLEVVDGALNGISTAVCVDGAPGGRWLSLESFTADQPDAEPAVDLLPGDPCYLIFTSGTTGIPRAAKLTHAGQWLDAAAIALELTLQPEDRHLATMPLYHIGGRALVLAHTLRGCTVHLQDGFEAERVLEVIERERITTTQLVPTMVARLLDSPGLRTRDLGSLRRIWYASAPMPVELMRRALETFGPMFLQGYGQTEAGPLVTALQPYEHALEGPEAARLGSCGRAVPGVEVRIRGENAIELPSGEVGEVEVRSPFLMTEYWEKPMETQETLCEGWLRTGDMAYIDEYGYLYIVDRKRDLIISGGENIYPREIEEVLYGHSAVLEASVIGVPDELWGESVKALVVLRDGMQVTEWELLGYCRERLAGYKCPKSIEFKEVLPKTASGKVLKRALRENYWQERQRRV